MAGVVYLPMGKVKFSFAVSEIRNKVGGVVYSRNRYGAYVRNYAVPTGAASSTQLFARNAFGTSSALWKTLTQSQRNDWQNFATLLSKTDVFNQQYKSTGFAVFMQVNQELQWWGGSIITTPPILYPMPLLTGLNVALNMSTSNLTWSFDRNNLTSDYAVVELGTLPQSTGVNFFKNLYRTFGATGNGTMFPLNLYGNFVAAFGTLISGKRYGCSAYVIDKRNGLRGSLMQTYFDVP